MRSSSEPYYSLLSKEGRQDIKFGLKHYGLNRDLARDILDHTWFGLKFNVSKIIRRIK